MQKNIREWVFCELRRKLRIDEECCFKMGVCNRFIARKKGEMNMTEQTELQVRNKAKSMCKAWGISEKNCQEAYMLGYVHRA